LWARKLDWYLNFCLTKGISHQSQTRPLPLESLLKNVAWKLPMDVEIEDNPLLIAAALRLPCDWVLLIENFEADKAAKKFHSLLHCVRRMSKKLSNLWKR
jgi:hypothetical protein